MVKKVIKKVSKPKKKSSPKKKPLKVKKKVVKKPVKKVSKKLTKKVIKEKAMGTITHYFRKIKVAVIKTKDTLKIGDEIRVKGGKVDFTQKVESIEIDGKKLKKVPKGKTIGLKLKKKAREGYKIYKLNV